jgi:hypothetical protein
MFLPFVNRTAHIRHRRFQTHETSANFTDASDFLKPVATLADFHALFGHGSWRNRWILQEAFSRIF